MASYPPRRTYGTGSVYEDAPGRWRGAAVLEDPLTGRRRRRTVTARSPEEARAKLDALRAVRVPTSSMRLRDWLEAWLPTTRLRVAPSSYRGYVSVVAGISARIGAVPLDALTASQVERMTAAMVAEGRTGKTAASARKVLRLALKQAIRDGLVVRNAASEARPPRVEPFTARTLTAPEARALLAATADDELGPLWAVLLSTGLRQGEALGLAWPDVDLAAGTLTVRRSLGRGWDGRLELGPPKSARSRRTIALPAAAREAFVRRGARQAAERTAAGAAWQDRDGLVFTDAIGRPLPSRYLLAELRAALERAGLPPIRCHDLRHTAATLQLAAGVPLATISRTLGHSTIAITADIYAAVTPDLRREAADAMDRALRED